MARAVEEEIVFEPTCSDVLLGRGTNLLTLNNPGNVWFRQVIHDNVKSYEALLLSNSPKKDKTAFIDQIVESIMREGRRFLKKKRKVAGHQEWLIVGPSEIHAKVQHALRDMAKATMKSPSKDRRHVLSSVSNKYEEKAGDPPIRPKTVLDGDLYSLDEAIASFVDGEPFLVEGEDKEMEAIIMAQAFLQLDCVNETGSIEGSQSSG